MEETSTIDKEKVKAKLLAQYWELLKQESALKNKQDKKLTDKIDKLQIALQKLSS